MHLLTKEEILAGIQTDPYLELFEENKAQAVVYDQLNGNVVTYCYPEYYTPLDLRERIHIASVMPRQATIDEDKLVDFLWRYVDHNTFVTLDSLWIVSRFEDYQYIADWYNDMSVYVIAQTGAKGFFWFTHRACIVDVPRIISWIKDNLGMDAAFDRHLREEILATILHELRHQMLDATIVLPKETYPKEWGTEFFVERYARELCDEINIHEIFR